MYFIIAALLGIISALMLTNAGDSLLKLNAARGLSILAIIVLLGIIAELLNSIRKKM